MEPRRSVSGGSAAKTPDHYAEKLSDPTLGTQNTLPSLYPLRCFGEYLRVCADAGGADTKHKVQQASELRDSIEVFQATDYKRFLTRLIPVFLKLLGEGQPIFVSTIPEQAPPLIHIAFFWTRKS